LEKDRSHRDEQHCANAEGDLNYAIKTLDAGININPATAIEYFPKKNRRDLLPPSDLPVWWTAVEKLENPSHRAYFKLVLLTGLRRKDAASIKLADIHEDRLHRPNPKGGAKRAFDVPVTTKLRAIIDEAKVARARCSTRGPSTCFQRMARPATFADRATISRWASVHTASEGLTRRPVSRQGSTLCTRRRFSITRGMATLR
jgi:integrase